ncbi:prolyl oligopeptidase [Sphaerotilus hippei]|uniref:Prolyl oligopeptidase n=1 Tax=Sphaerotilus hippei TaxID=744406 RepID=A0A318GXA5_9BURK|nr:prolyl oligopeptidase family serine peptidase [Sphaerotilus hippei]PXW93835.1 prolyl oligopeptidase [Sphaerotilus hippei]
MPEAPDPHLWLEDVTGEAPLAWVQAHNARTSAELTARPEYLEFRPRLLALMDAPQRIPHVRRVGPQFYNFWQDAGHRRGLWRRTTLDSYRQPAPDWQPVLDLDALAAAEGENWVWHGAVFLSPRPGGDWRRCLVRLSRGGADAVVVREFDVVTGAFVAGGFELPEAKSEVDWLDEDTLLVATDFGPGTLTDSGYPRVVRRWSRGTPLSAAVTVHEGESGDVSVWARHDDTPGHERVVFGRSLDFYTSRMWLQAGDGRLLPLPKPDDASLGLHREWALLELRSALVTDDGHTHPAGSLLIARLDDLLAGQPAWTALFVPTPTCSLGGTTWTRDHLLLNLLDQVANRVEALRLVDGAWQRRAIDLPGPGALGIAALHEPHLVDDPLAEHCWVTYTDFLTPDSLMLARADQAGVEVLKQRPAWFDTDGMRVEQRHATSADGTRVPYFVIWPRGVEPDGDNPTLLYGYGGFEVSLQPWYSAGFGLAWYGRGGVLVVANLRGGGEFGPAWHQAAIREHKQRSYDDFIAVAEDLVRTGVTRPARLGIMGGSNGGLLVGAAMTQRPDLFGAVVCQVPLLDMKRYHLLLAGASWMAEYGNPDVPQQWAWIERYSPYQHVRADVRYPRALFTTSTRDDRVHPGHARKMVARLEAAGHPVLYFENIEGGHGGAADNEQRAHLQALEFAYLWTELSAPAAG